MEDSRLKLAAAWGHVAYSRSCRLPDPSFQNVATPLHAGNTGLGTLQPQPPDVDCYAMERVANDVRIWDLGTGDWELFNHSLLTSTATPWKG
jgi:hypothetical protein